MAHKRERGPQSKELEPVEEDAAQHLNVPVSNHYMMNNNFRRARAAHNHTAVRNVFMQHPSRVSYKPRR
jgi:hypothetical protein